MIYFVQADGVGHIKIGFTDGEDAAVRLATLQVGSPVPLRLLGVIRGTLSDEKDLHRRFAAHRVVGEWFKPVADLMALIPTAAPLECESVAVVEQTVSIRVLTVGRKQFSRSLLEQLPAHFCLDWGDVISTMLAAVDHNMPAAEIAQHLPRFLMGDVWGWVANRDGTRWVVFVDEGVLCRHLDEQALANRVLPMLTDDAAHNRRIAATAMKIYRARDFLPGWRPEDQLFIGV